MRTTDITLTRSEAYTVCDILKDYIDENNAKANNDSLSKDYRDVCYECAVEVSRIRNRILQNMRVHRY